MAKFNTYLLRKWVLSCRLRDGNTCHMCKRVGRIEVHHIYPKSIYPEKAYLLNNGVSLCKRCHIAIVHAENTWDLTNWRDFVIMFNRLMGLAKYRKFNEKYQERIWTPEKQVS